MDEVDVRLLKALAANSRVPYRELADSLELSVNSIHKRVQALVDEGIIAKFVAYPSTKALPWVMIGIGGTTEAADPGEAAARIGSHPCTQRVGIASSNHLLVVGLLKGIPDMNRYISFVIAEGKIASPKVSLIHQHEPRELASEALTSTDYRILAAIQDNSRKQIAEVAEELEITAKTVRRRLDRMESEGLIHYSINVNLDSSGYVYTSYLLKMKTGADPEALLKTMKAEFPDSMIAIWKYDTSPGEVNFNLIARTMKETNLFRDRLQQQGVCEKITPLTVYRLLYFDTWREALIREKASASQKK
ncbi:Lrp/AsnC family transcriptional regulator [Methanocella sp. MCL-LM]|uniref:Lrp/AsnC family transcriptional regulator n=1 Tax=Methanocella sp. MCL-LM TaxID=3412035 RepID=UPI003C76B698